MPHRINAPIEGNAVVGQSGGPTVVINQSLVGVVEALRGVRGIEKVLGCYHGVSGIRNNQFLELQNVSQQRLDHIAQTPSAALGSSRDKPDAEYCKVIFENFARNDVHYFFYIGGNDSSDTARIVSELAEENGYPLRCFHVPKTIDNDLVHNDHTPGYGSAAKFVAQAFMGDNLDNRALPGIKINVVMGRHAGFLTAASMLGRQSDDDGPHLIYVPEVAFDVDQFLADVDAVYSKHGRCLIAVSEGIHASDGTPMITKLAEEVERDAHGNIQLSGSGALGDHLANKIRTGLSHKKLRVRADTFGYLQRSFAGCTSLVDAQEAREVGHKAVKAALGDRTSGSVTIRRIDNFPYRVDYPVVDLSAVAGKTRTLDPQYIENDNNIADSFRSYAQPLVAGLPVVEKLQPHFTPVAQA